MAVTFSRDADGRALAHVPLSNRAEVVRLWRDDYDAIVSRFGEAAWFANDTGSGSLYIRFWNAERGTNETVPRLITGAPPRRHVRPRNRNPFDLTRTNLEVIQPRQRSRVVEFRPATLGRRPAYLGAIR